MASDHHDSADTPQPAHKPEMWDYSPLMITESEIHTLWQTQVDSEDADPGVTLKAPDVTAVLDKLTAEPEAAPAASAPTIRDDATLKDTSPATGTSTVKPRKTRLVDAKTMAPDAATAAMSDFMLKEPIGRGGMGMVYLARQSSLDRDVAVKMIHAAAMGKANSREKLVAEALVTGELDHPNIIPIYELGIADDGRLFYAMKVVRGKPWSAEIKDRSERENIDILLRVADAVAFAHDKGVVHRDLKPENVMLGDYGEVLLMDWGLAVGKALDAKAELLSSLNAKAGTPAYMAPEMARGMADAIGPASDIYLLGGILYEILTGRRPHGGATVMACLRAAAENILLPTDRKDELVDVARKAMATRPEDRHPSVKAFQKALASVLSHGESLSLSRHAADYLDKAEHTGDYEQYSQAIFAYREAIKLWDGNLEAVEGELAARKKFAAAALGRGDLDLALTYVGDLADTESQALARKIRDTRREIETRRKRIRFLTRAAVVLTALVVVTLVGATIIITDRMHKEREARELATEQERIATAALTESREARERERLAAAERERALASEKAAQDAALAAAREREGALLREKEAQDARLAALAREAEERRQREEAEKAQQEVEDELARKGQLEQSQRWTFDAAEAADRQTAAAERLRGDGAWSAGFPAADSPPVIASAPIAPNAPASFALIPRGEFVMGSSPRDPYHAPSEYLHRVEIGADFWLGVTEVTRGQWRAVAGMERMEDILPATASDTGDARGDEYRNQQRKAAQWRTRPLEPGEENLPATGVSPTDIDAVFLPRLAAAPAGWRFALPTEAEWEYAVRAGTAEQFFNGDYDEGFSPVGWLRENSGLVLHPAGGTEANPWGLKDVYGNAGEIVRDAYAQDYYLASPIQDPVNLETAPFRTFRGGTYIHDFRKSRSASRNNVHVDNRYEQIGFRLALLRENTL